MNRPFECPFECLAARGGLAALVERAKRLERRVRAILRYDDQRRTIAAQPRYLQIAAVLPNVWIKERARLVRLIETAVAIVAEIVDHVVEHDRKTQPADVDRGVRLVLDVEMQD